MGQFKQLYRIPKRTDGKAESSWCRRQYTLAFPEEKTAYAMGKIRMSVLTIGLAMDLEREDKRDMAVTSIWPAMVSL